MPQLQCEEIRFPSADGVHTVAASMYTMPRVPVRAVLQLSHGMCEYVQRYRPMAQWYAQRGIALAGNDHLGHGGTANKGEHGHYGEPRGRYHLLNDLLCTFPFTAATYREMLATLCHVSSRKWAQNIRKDLPVLLIAGTADPVGDYGAGVRKVWAMLGDAGVQDLSCEIWHDARHELHNETNREEVFDYVYGWLMDRLPEDESQ